MKLIINILISIILTIPLISFSQDRNFAWSYNSTVLSKGAKDLEAWSTFRTGRKYFYNRIDNRLELELGLTDKLQTAFYLNSTHRAFGANKDTLGGIADTEVDGVFSESEFSVSSEWKWKLTDPVVNPIGFALYGEITVAPSEVELEHKFIFDKKFEKDVVALNLVSEYEYAAKVTKGAKVWELAAIDAEADLGYMHFFKPTCGFGLEIRNSNEISKGKDWQHSALFGGPTFFHSGEKYYLILNLLPQWINLKKTTDAPDNLVLNEHEKFAVRLLLGFGL